LSRGRPRNSLAAVCIIIPAGGHKSRHHLSYYVPMIQISAQMLSADTLCVHGARGRKNMFVPREREELSFSTTHTLMYFLTHTLHQSRVRARMYLRMKTMHASEEVVCL
jgi:hypothetical protein